MTDQTTEHSVSFFGKMLTFSRIKLLTDDFDVIKSQLSIVSPEKNSLIPIVIDSEVNIDLKKLLDLLWEWGLQPIGVTKGKLDEQAKKLRLAIFPADGKRLQRVKPQTKAKQVVSPTAEQSANTASQPKPASDDTKNKSLSVKLDKEQTAVTKTANTDTANSPSDSNTASKETDTEIKIDSQDNDSKNHHSKNHIETKVKTDSENSTKTETNTNINDGKVDTHADGKAKASNTEGNGNDTESTTETETEKETPTPVQVIHVVEQITSLVYDQMLRSGQSINHVGGDLILTNSVNDGAEAITDNSLHIYGKGMGRLVAGATGDEDAHIFCQRFNPSLVSVAGTYMLRDSIPVEFIDKAVQVSFKEGEGLIFRVMDNWSQTITHNTISR